MQFPRHKQKIMLDDLIEAAEAITFQTETQTKKGRKYNKKVAIALWPQGEESMQTPHTCSSQYEDNYEHDADARLSAEHDQQTTQGEDV